ncbi:ATP-binding protein [Lentzea sp. NEAU-D13]|uniref:ATP-binding protein n=1 Tax=Lentzea alba TaxID=2714351 RepID=A0A7C9RS34_9PSEU|nr:ATP-binding protein [Lentzea alba]NGY59222.1 ATP-binding protein [Lentzea alba]
MKLTAVRIKNFRSIADTGVVELGDINVIVGRNNSGKSAFVRALHMIQQGGVYENSPVRLNETSGSVHYTIKGDRLTDDVNKYFNIQFGSDASGIRTLGIGMEFFRSGDKMVVNRKALAVSMTNGAENELGFEEIRASEPRNYIYPYLSNRKVATYSESVDLLSTRRVSSDLSNLYAKIDRISTPQHHAYEKFSELCAKVIGFQVGTQASGEGKVAGIPIGREDYVALSSMGEGVPNLLGLIVNLCVAEGNLFLIEELENDIHPQALKALLEAIVESSDRNQFVVSTHSNVVLRHLGSAPNCKVFSVSVSAPPREIPVSTLTEVGQTSSARIGVLRELGYELYDFELWDGWLILEESTAEAIIRRFLIPWFAPGLNRVRTLAAGGTAKAEPAFEDFRRLFLYLHLEAQYHERAWVMLDGDPSGREVIDKLREKYGTTWPQEHFDVFSEHDFERYYPLRFSEESDRVLSLNHREKRPAKKALFDIVVEWCLQNEELAKAEFAESAAEIINFLQAVERKIRC